MNTFSIIIPTYNRPKQLESCLEAICHLDYPYDCFEVIVADDGSINPPSDIVSSFSDRLDIKLITQKNSGPAAARNTGADYVKGKYLAFTDDDCLPDSDWLRYFAEQFDKFPDCAIGGKTVNLLSDNPYSEASQMLIDFVYSRYNINPNQARFLTSNNIAVPRDIFHEIEGFNPEFSVASEDREFCDRWLAHGYSIIYAPEAVIFHAHKLTLKKFWKQHFNYGRGAFHFHRMRSRKIQGKSMEPSFYYLNMLMYPIFRLRNLKGILLSMLFLLSQAASFAGYFREKNM